MNKTLEQVDDAFNDDNGVEGQEVMREILGEVRAVSRKNSLA